MAEGHGEGSENQQADKRVGSAVRGSCRHGRTPGKLSCWPQALLEMDSSEPVRYWSKGVSGKALLPLCSQQGPAQLHTTLQPGWGLKLPWLRALQNQHLQSTPGCRRAPKSHPNSLPAWHPGTTPPWPILPELCSSHQSLHSTCAQVCSPKLPKPFLSHCPSLLLQSPARWAISSASTSPLQLQAQVLLPQRLSSPRLRLSAPAAACWEHRDQRETSGL